MKHRSRPGRLCLPLLLGLVASCQNDPTPRSAAHEPPVAAAAPAAAAPAAASAGVPSGGEAAPAPAEPAKDDDGAKGATQHIRAEGQLGPGENTLYIDLAPPAGAKLTLESPVNVRGSGGIGLEFPRRLSGPLGSHPMPLRLPIDVADGATGPARLELTYYWCTEGNEAACRREQAHLDVELDLSGSGAGGEAHLSYRARGTS